MGVKIEEGLKLIIQIGVKLSEVKLEMTQREKEK